MNQARTRRRALHRRVDVARLSRRQPRGFPRAAAGDGGAHGSGDGGLDIGCAGRDAIGEARVGRIKRRAPTAAPTPASARSTDPPHATRGRDNRRELTVSPVPLRVGEIGAQRSAAAEMVDGATDTVGPWAAAMVASAKMVTAIATIMRANMMPSVMISPTNLDTHLLVASAGGNVQREGWFRSRWV
jgi:hypothetical protein